MQQTKWVTLEVARSLDTVLEALRWCRQNLHERAVSARLQQVDIALGALALALDHEMDGEQDRSQAAIEQADWRDLAARFGWQTRGQQYRKVDVEVSPVIADAAAFIDEVLESLRWCRQNLVERGVTQKLRELGLTLAAVSLAIQFDMDGDATSAETALIHAGWTAEIDGGEEDSSFASRC